MEYLNRGNLFPAAGAGVFHIRRSPAKTHDEVAKSCRTVIADRWKQEP